MLVTGCESGLGKHCAAHFNATGFSRHTDFAEIKRRAAEKPYRAIIHAAFNPKPHVSRGNLYNYLNDTTLLTQKLLQIPHEKFIFISTADVYPEDQRVHEEDEDIHLKDIRSIYAMSKLMSESMVQEESAGSLILRPSALLGEHARKNSLIKMLTEQDVTLTLSAQSTFNYVLHTDVSQFIEKALQDRLTGIYNIAAATSITLAKVANDFNREVNFGDYTYLTRQVSNEKASRVLDNFKRTSLQNINLFIGK